MQIEIQIVDENGRRGLIKVEAVKAFEIEGFSFYRHEAYQAPYSYSITEKTSGLTVFTGKGIKATTNRAKSICTENAAKLKDKIAIGVYNKGFIATCELFKGAFGIK